MATSRDRPAKCLMQRAFALFGEARYEQLSTISVTHLYNLRQAAGYQDRRRHWTKTKGHSVPIAERRAPVPDTRPGFSRIDSVHQGELDGRKGLYHINAVDRVTQFEIVATCEQLSEAYLLPVIETMLDSFPFSILGFHADCGSEYINHKVAEMLDKLRVEFNKSRPRHSNDNALAESKNGAVVRKHMGYGYIAAPHAAAMEAFYEQHFNPYLNFHRPCGVPESVVDHKGKVKKKYGWYATPWEILRQLPNLASHLNPAVTIEELDRRGGPKTKNGAGRGKQKNK